MSSIRLLSCCSQGEPALTRAEHIRNALVIVLGTLALSLVAVGLKFTVGQVPAVVALQNMLLPAVMVLWADSTYLSRRSWRARTAFVGTLLVLLYVIGLAGALL